MNNDNSPGSTVLQNEEADLSSSQCLESFETIAKEYHKLAYPPLRPSKDDLRVFEKTLRAAGIGPQSRVLVFGSTPELRDLALRHGASVTAADHSPQMMAAMTQLMVENRQREEQLTADWLGIPRDDSSYDIAMGDNFLNMLPSHLSAALVNEISRLPKPGGHVVATFMFLPPDDKKLEDLVAAFESDQIALGDLVFFANRTTWNPETRMNFTGDSLGRIEQLCELGKAGQKTREAIAPLGHQHFYITLPPEQEMDELLEQRFEIKAKEPGRDFPCCPYRPVYLLRSKKS